MEKCLLFLVVLVLGLGPITGGWGQSERVQEAPWRIHTLFSVECQNYFDWQTVGLMHSFKKARQPGPITRLLSCTEEEKGSYRGMELAPTLEVPSMSRHPRTGDWYPAINKPAGIVHWLNHSKDSQNVDWVVILDADMIIRGPIIPWELGAEKGRPVAAYYGYLIGCDNILAQLHTKHPEICDKVGGLLAMHIDDLRALAPMWLSKTEEVREDRAHWMTNITGDIYSKGWISEMYGYSFGAAEVGLRHKINDNLMIYPGYIPREGVEPILMHYGLPFHIGNWSFSKLDHHEDDIVYDCGRLFPEPPYPREIKALEADPNRRRALFLNIECINTLNEGLLLQHATHGCPKPKWSKYLSLLRSKTFADLTRPKFPTPDTLRTKEDELQQQVSDEPGKPHPKIHTVFSTECTPYFDWQTVGLIHSFHTSGQPGNITRLLSCTDEELKNYKGRDLAPTHYVPSMSLHPLTGDWYPAINKPAAVLHWLNHVNVDAEFIVILDADMIMRGPITPWEFNAALGRPVSTPYDYLIGCHNELAKLHTRNPEACDKVGGVIIMHIDDLRKFALLWLHKTEEVRADTAHYAKNITGDIYESGWISEMYGYSFGAAELNLRHIINGEILIYPGYVPQPGVKYRVFHYGLEFRVGNWSFDKANWRTVDVVNKCWSKFPDPPDPSMLDRTDENTLQRDLLSIECAKTLNKALLLHHERRNCSDPTSLSTSNQETSGEVTLSRKFGKIDTVHVVRSDTVLKNDSIESSKDSKESLDDSKESLKDSKESSEDSKESFDAKESSQDSKESLDDSKESSEDSQKPLKDSKESSNDSKISSLSAVTNQTFSSFRFWIVYLWIFGILGFLAVMYTMLSGRRGHRKRGKNYKHNRRPSYSGYIDTNGHDRHLRNAESS
ncbi:hypothetical protein RHMOL_Rhmol05G0117500 [Rhododendron molle]|uniref:Uncharacterized protein n=1 Tax=Rhododendron molle TaxID=49168 RepID=A0ACC0NQ52_RHOML|nr:hypothetical protein RHMOL_Rhmol05G0117500 [Rhododendron molle]